MQLFLQSGLHVASGSHGYPQQAVASDSLQLIGPFPAPNLTVVEPASVAVVGPPGYAIVVLQQSGGAGVSNPGSGYQSDVNQPIQNVRNTGQFPLDRMHNQANHVAWSLGQLQSGSESVLHNAICMMPGNMCRDNHKALSCSTESTQVPDSEAAFSGSLHSSEHLQWDSSQCGSFGPSSVGGRKTKSRILSSSNKNQFGNVGTSQEAYSRSLPLSGFNTQSSNVAWGSPPQGTAPSNRWTGSNRGPEGSDSQSQNKSRMKLRNRPMADAEVPTSGSIRSERYTTSLSAEGSKPKPRNPRSMPINLNTILFDGFRSSHEASPESLRELCLDGSNEDLPHDDPKGATAVNGSDGIKHTRDYHGNPDSSDKAVPGDLQPPSDEQQDDAEILKNVSLEEVLKKVPLDENGLLTSVGSIGHHMSACKPQCAFILSKGCPKGVECNFCHFAHPQPQKKPRPCKGKREWYRRQWERVRSQLHDDPDAFDVGDVKIPPSILSYPWLKGKFETRIKSYRDSIKSERMEQQECDQVREDEQQESERT